MEMMVGSRFMNINREDSDYDVIVTYQGGLNRHCLKIGTYNNRKLDIHEFVFESKDKLISHILDDENRFSYQCLIYEDFRKYWGITLQEALFILRDKEFQGCYLRPYEYYFFECQLNGTLVEFSKLKYLYETYREDRK